MQTKRTTYYLLAAALTGFVAMVSSCENDPKVVDALYSKQIAVEEAKNIESYMSQQGKVKAKLTAPYMLRYQKVDSPYMEFPRTMHVDFYNDSTVIESTVDSKYAKYVEYDHKVLLRDSVLVLNLKSGDTLKTQELWWDQDKQEFYTSKPAHILQPDKIIFAKYGLKAAQDLKSYTLYGSTGPMLVPDNGLPK